MKLDELESLDSVVNVTGLALAVYRTSGGGYGWVLTAGLEPVAFDGWYFPQEDESLQPLLTLLRDPDPHGLEEARVLNNRQLGEALTLCGNPLVESGLDAMPARSDDEDSRGWGSAGLRDNKPFRSAEIVAVAALGSAKTLRWLASRI